MAAKKITAEKMAAASAQATGGLLDGLMTKEDAAAELRVSLRSIESYAKQGLLVMAYIGRTPYVDIERSNRRLRGERDPTRRRRRRQAEEMSA